MSDARSAITRPRLAFLHGDLCLPAMSVAEIFDVAESDVVAARERLSVMWSHHVFGRLTRSAFRQLATVLGFDSRGIETVLPRREWVSMRDMLGREFQRLGRERTIPWADVDAFLRQLPNAVADAAARVTESRLRFLYGDLSAMASDVMTILNTTIQDVLYRLAIHGIERHDAYAPALNERVLDKLAGYLGLAEWEKDHAARERPERYRATMKREVREGLLSLAKDGRRLDLAALDRFIADIPKLVADDKASKLPAWLFSRRVWILHCIACMPAAEIVEQTGWLRLDVDRVLTEIASTRRITQEALEAVASREFDKTIGSATLPEVRRFVEGRQEKLRDLLRRKPTIPWEHLAIASTGGGNGRRPRAPTQKVTEVVLTARPNSDNSGML